MLGKYPVTTQHSNYIFCIQVPITLPLDYSVITLQSNYTWVLWVIKEQQFCVHPRGNWFLYKHISQTVYSKNRSRELPRSENGRKGTSSSSQSTGGLLIFLSWSNLEDLWKQDTHLMLKGAKCHPGKMHGEESGGFEDNKKRWCGGSRGAGDKCSVCGSTKSDSPAQTHPAALLQKQSSPECSSTAPEPGEFVPRGWAPDAPQGGRWHLCTPDVHSCVPRHQSRPVQSLGTGTPGSEGSHLHSSSSSWGPGTKPHCSLLFCKQFLQTCWISQRGEGRRGFLKQRLLPPADAACFSHQLLKLIPDHTHHCYSPCIPEWHLLMAVSVRESLLPTFSDQLWKLRSNMGSTLRAQSSGTVP